MAVWGQLALIFSVFGFEMNLLTTLNSEGTWDEVSATLLLGFILYLIATILVLLFNFGELAGTKLVAMASTACIFLAGEFLSCVPV